MELNSSPLQTPIIMNANKTKHYWLFSIMLLASSCCINVSDSFNEISEDQIRWIPDSTIRSFIMESEHGIKESFVLRTYNDTTITLTDQCDCKTVFRQRNSEYISTLNNYHNFEMEINSLNYVRMDIGINWDQQASWNFSENRNIPHAYTSNDYPNPSDMIFVKNKTINGTKYPEVLVLKFAQEDIDESGITEANFIPKYGIVSYTINNSIKYYRKPMP